MMSKNGSLLHDGATAAPLSLINCQIDCFSLFLRDATRLATAPLNPL
jgi:hypothetical protein